MLTTYADSTPSAIKTYWFSSPSGTVYTVPAGKTARVWVVGYSSASFGANGVNITGSSTGSTGAYGQANIPSGFLFPAGTVITGNGTGTLYIEEQ